MLGGKVGGGLWLEAVMLPGRGPPFDIEKEVDDIGGATLEVDPAGMVLDKTGQLGTPGGQDVTKMTLVENTVVVDCVDVGTGSMVGRCEGWPEKLGSALGVA